MPQVAPRSPSPALTDSAGSASIEDEQGDDADPIELVLLGCYQSAHSIPVDILKDAFVIESIERIHEMVAFRCSHNEGYRVASLYYIKNDLAFREIRLCHKCFVNTYTTIQKIVDKYPDNSIVSFYANVGRVVSFYRYVLIV